jgi:nucleotide-binding universal stress UspA family protein
VSDTELLTNAASAIVNEAQTKAVDAGCHRVEAMLQTGDPAGRIIQVAKERGIDLIVMGRRGLGDMNGPLLGSVSHKVVQLAECACLIVK